MIELDELQFFLDCDVEELMGNMLMMDRSLINL